MEPTSIVLCTMSGFLKSSEQIHGIDKAFFGDHHKTLRESVSRPPVFHCLISVIHTGGHFPFAQDLRAELTGFYSRVSCGPSTICGGSLWCLTNQILFFQPLNRSKKTLKFLTTCRCSFQNFHLDHRGHFYSQAPPSLPQGTKARFKRRTLHEPNRIQ